MVRTGFCPSTVWLVSREWHTKCGGLCQKFLGHTREKGAPHPGLENQVARTSVRIANSENSQRVGSGSPNPFPAGNKAKPCLLTGYFANPGTLRWAERRKHREADNCRGNGVSLSIPKSRGRWSGGEYTRTNKATGIATPEEANPQIDQLTNRLSLLVFPFKTSKPVLGCDPGN